MSISISELLSKNNINIIDIRSIEKYNDNHIDGARNIPMILLLKDPSKYLEYGKIYYIYCQKGVVPIDYTILRTAIADNGKKLVKEDLGRPESIVICHNDDDRQL